MSIQGTSVIQNALRVATLEILILRPVPGRATNQRTDILETAYMEKCPKYSIWRVLDPGEEIVLFVFFHRASRESNLELVFFSRAARETQTYIPSSFAK